jgi:hypothetical protein
MASIRQLQQRISFPAAYLTSDSFTAVVGAKSLINAWKCEQAYQSMATVKSTYSIGDTLHIFDLSEKLKIIIFGNGLG